MDERNIINRIYCKKTRAAACFFLLILFSLNIPQFCREDKLSSEESKKEVKKALFLCGFTLATAILIKNDTCIRQDILAFKETHCWVRSVSPVVTRLGSLVCNMGLIGSLYLGGIWLKDDRVRETARLGFESLLYALAASQVIKRLFRRQRPYVDDGRDRWFNHGMGHDFRSFPSGHTTFAWSTAAVIAGMYKDKPVVPVICYSLAALVGVSRITENKHWASDVLIGALLGYSIGRFVLKKKNNRLNVIPLVYGQQAGLRLSFSF